MPVRYERRDCHARQPGLVAKVPAGPRMADWDAASGRSNEWPVFALTGSLNTPRVVVWWVDSVR